MLENTVVKMFSIALNYKIKYNKLKSTYNISNMTELFG